MRHFNPDSLLDFTEFGFSQIAVDAGTGVAYVSGQAAVAKNGTVIGATFETQLKQVERNLRAAFRFLKAKPENILMIRGFVVDLDEEDLLPYAAFRKRLFKGNVASTLVSVSKLALEPLIVEVEAQIVVGKKMARKLACGQMK